MLTRAVEEDTTASIPKCLAEQTYPDANALYKALLELSVTKGTLSDAISNIKAQESMGWDSSPQRHG